MHTHTHAFTHIYICMSAIYNSVNELHRDILLCTNIHTNIKGIQM